jgi:hypothetical protein
MRCLVLLAALIGVFATPAGANQWKVRDLTVDQASDQSKLMLVVSKASIQVIRRANDTVVTTIDPKDVVSMWYDDKLVEGSRGREWAEAILGVYDWNRPSEDILGPLALLAAAGVGYLVAEPFSKRQHVVNIRYRAGERIEWLTLGINWVDYFWLMEDLKKVTGLKWLDMPLQRTKLFWSFDDHGYQFQSWWATGDVPVPAGQYKVIAWEDGKGKGVLMVFEKSDETPAAVAVESVLVERVAPSDTTAEYCVDDGGKRRLVRFTLHKKRMVLPVWEAACRRASEPGDAPSRSIP